jgi:hypothetical protein
VAPQIVVAIKLAITTWLTADIPRSFWFLVFKVVPDHVLFIPTGISTTLAFVLAGLVWVVDVKVMPVRPVSFWID